ncbi:MAG: metal-sensitive transcriptional regulator [Patescibacteria group bacterium]|jgi:DNA-binding FrmR family transcriptional regulator|nr:metal-sensitive transcriptional regulator [Patescibacteria group bacterium]
MKTTEQLINNIIGQANGVKKMIEEKKNCYLVINQMKAVKSAISSIMDKYIEENMNTCLKDPGKKESKEMMQKLIKEITKK